MYKRQVLDGALDPTADATGQAENRAIGAEQAFDAFAADCVAHNCPLGTDPRQAVRDLLDQLRGQRVPGGDRPGGAGVDAVPLTAGTALRAILRGLEDRSAWSRLAEAIAAARTGSGNALTAWAAPLVLDSSQDDPPLLDGELVTGCNDTASRLPPEQVSKLAQDWQTKHPLFGVLFAQQLVLCGPWPVPAQPLPDTDLAGAPPVLVLSTAADPVVPAAATERAAQHLSQAVLVSWQGGGHGAFPRVSCTTTLVQRFLVDGQVPEDGTVCPP